VIYLRASVASLVQRTSHDRNRPLLQTADPKAKIESLARERGPLYEEVAHIVIETGRPNVQAIVQNILSQIASLAPAPQATHADAALPVATDSGGAASPHPFA
jgi:3-dehydroquinate synthase